MKKLCILLAVCSDLWLFPIKNDYVISETGMAANMQTSWSLELDNQNKLSATLPCLQGWICAWQLLWRAKGGPYPWFLEFLHMYFECYPYAQVFYIQRVAAFLIWHGDYAVFIQDAPRA